MKNKMIKSPEELQKHVDYIIQYSNIIELCENRVKKEEEYHINVDAILSAPLTPLKPASKTAKKETLSPRSTHAGVKHSLGHVHILAMPRREKLIVHGEIFETKRNIQTGNIFTSLFR